MLRKTASLLAALTACIHFFLGGRDALAPMFAAGLPPVSEAAMHACWHMVTFMLVWSVVVFWNGGKPVLHFAILWIASAIVFIYVGITQAGMQGLISNPQWTIISVTGAIAMLSYRIDDKSEPGTNDNA